MRKFTWVVALGVTLCIAGSARADLANGLLNYWNFDNNTDDSAGSYPGSASTVDDNGTFDGANGTDGIGYGAGAFGAGISLNGAGGGAAGQENDGFVRVLRSADTLMGAHGSTVSISAWVQTGGFDTGWQTLLAHGEGNQYRIARRGSDSVLGYAGGVGDIPGSAIGPDVSNGTGWHHVVAISEGGVSTRLWVDGGLVATGGAPVIDDAFGGGTPDFYIGGNPSTGAQNREWWGEIDDVAVWNRVLSDEEVGDLYFAGDSLGSQIVPEPTSALLAILGVMSLGLGARRRRRSC